MNTDTDKATLIAESILESKKTSVLTGAGISTESGIPDFRDKSCKLSSFCMQKIYSYK